MIVTKKVKTQWLQTRTGNSTVAAVILG